MKKREKILFLLLALFIVALGVFLIIRYTELFGFANLEEKYEDTKQMAFNRVESGQGGFFSGLSNALIILGVAVIALIAFFIAYKLIRGVD